MPLLSSLTRGLLRGKFNMLQGKGPLSSKRANRRFYKGTGGRKEGRHTSKGKYVIQEHKLLDLEVPDLTGFQLKPYVCAAALRLTPVKLPTA